MDEEAQAAYDQLTTQWLDGEVPLSENSCKDCLEGAAIGFNVLSDDDPHEVDNALGHSIQNVTVEWLFSNQWVTPQRQEKNFRNTFLLRVFTELEQIVDLKTYTEIVGFIGEKGYKFSAIEDSLGIADSEEGDLLITPGFLEENLQGNCDHRAKTAQISGNFYFHMGMRTIFYASFTNARWETKLHYGFGHMLQAYIWEWSGQYDVRKAALQLKDNYESAQERHEALRLFLTRASGALDIALAIAVFIPVVGEVVVVGRGALAAIRVARYAFYGLEAFVGGMLLADGSVKLFLGENWKLGEGLFVAIADAAGADNPQKRGEQVFLLANLALLLPAAGGGTKWILTKIPATRNGVMAYDMAQAIDIAATQATRITASRGELLALRLRMFRTGRTNEEAVTHLLVTYTPSFDHRSAWFIDILPTTWKANARFRAPTAMGYVTQLLHHNSSEFQVMRRLTTAIGDCGEEAVLLETFLKIPGARVLGYERGCLGFKTVRENGLDNLIMVPAGTSINLRFPTTPAGRYKLSGTTREVVQVRPVTFAEDTLIVLEVKTTLGTIETPRTLSTQLTGAQDVDRIFGLLEGTGKNGWTTENLLRVDPLYTEKLDALRRAYNSGNIFYIQSGVYLHPNGTLRAIQHNIW